MSRWGTNPVRKWEGVMKDSTTEQARLQGDRELHAILLRDDFAGPNYREFQNVLIDYGFGVIGAWVRKGTLLTKCREKGVRGLPAGQSFRTEGLDQIRQEELTTDIVADGIIRFDRDSMHAGKWNPRGQASMRTWFIGGCLFSSAGNLKRLAEEQREFQQRADLHQQVVRHYPDFDQPLDLAASAVDIADVVAGHMIAQEIRDQLNPADLELLELKEEGLSRPEIASRIGTTPKGMDSRWNRIRRQIQQWREDAG